MIGNTAARDRLAQPIQRLKDRTCRTEIYVLCRAGEHAVTELQREATFEHPVAVAAKVALARAELPDSIRFHDLRHAAATIMLEKGVHLKVASERLGHSNVGITGDLYMHAVPGLEADAATKLQGAIRQKRSNEGQAAPPIAQ